MTTEQTGAPRNLNTRVAIEIRALMGRYGVTQTTLAGALDINQGQVSKRLRGIIPFTLDEIESISAYFKIAPSKLLGYAEAPHPDGPDGGQVISLGSRRARRDSNPQPAVLWTLPSAAAA